ncbi:MAG: molybdopterin converting factor subunit 1 [Chloroflexi bacterium]|nr:molybdopterin converting factor subunit 1 [Chloroflexota bacterium]
MKIRVRFFALLRELTGKGVDEFEVKSPATAGAFREEVLRRYPALKDYLEHVTMAINAEYAGTEAQLKDGDEVAFLPPLSGG